MLSLTKLSLTERRIKEEDFDQDNQERLSMIS